MYCKLKNREVEIFTVKEAMVGQNKIQFKDCSGNHKEMPWGKVRLQCDTSGEEGCLLNK